MAEKDRIRTHKVNVWLLDEEKALLQKQAYELGLSQSDYLRKLILYGGMFTSHFSMDKEQANKLLYELNRIGNNINQIAYNTNAKTFAAKGDWVELKKNYFKLLELVGTLPFLDKEAQEEWLTQVYTLLPKQ